MGQPERLGDLGQSLGLSYRDLRLRWTSDWPESCQPGREAIPRPAECGKEGGTRQDRCSCIVRLDRGILDPQDRGILLVLLISVVGWHADVEIIRLEDVLDFHPTDGRPCVPKCQTPAQSVGRHA